MDRGTSISVDGADRARTLSSIDPSESLKTELDELFRETDDYGHGWSPLDWHAIDTGNRVDGEPWGWTPTRSGWRVVPIEFFETAERVISVSGWQRASMTSGVSAVGALQQAGITIYWSDLDPEGQEIAVEYAASPIAAVVATVLRDALDTVVGWAPCPACEEESRAWEITMEVGPSVDDAAISDALGRLWKPCTKHASKPDALCVILSGRRWCFDAARWVPRSTA